MRACVSVGVPLLILGAAKHCTLAPEDCAEAVIVTIAFPVEETDTVTEGPAVVKSAYEVDDVVSDVDTVALAGAEATSSPGNILIFRAVELDALVDSTTPRTWPGDGLTDPAS